MNRGKKQAPRAEGPARPAAVTAWAQALWRGCTWFAKDVSAGLFLVSHNALAMLGLTVLGLALLAYGRPDLRQGVEEKAYGWLHARHGLVADDDEADVVASLADASAVERATATDPTALPAQQAAVALWISRRYKVAPEPIGRLVQEAWDVGTRLKVEPTLILAIMAIESSFNPFAQSAVGAQGLMQVMTHIHDKKYQPFGGTHAAFDPVTNLRVGVQVLKECIAKAGSLHDGLRFYVGAANLESDGGYAGKVLAEHQNLQQVAAGKRLSPQMALVPVVLPPRVTPANTEAASADAEPTLQRAPPAVVPPTQPPEASAPVAAPVPAHAQVAQSSI
jgi:hypothetical protein